MYIVSDILQASPSGLFKLLGWRQPTETGYAILDVDNVASASYRYFDDFNYLLSIKNIKSAISDPAISSTNFNTYLLNFQKAAILKLLDAVFSEQGVIENKVVYPFENKMTETITLGSGDFVGHKLTLPARKDIVITINNVVTEFDSIDTVRVYLFHSSQKTAISYVDVTTQAYSSKVSNVGWQLKFNSSGYVGGQWYIGYLTAGKTAKPLKRNFEDANLQSTFNCLKVESCKFTGHTATTLPDISTIEYTDDTFGLNYDITAASDQTSKIIDNAHSFVNGIGLQFAADAMELFINSDQINIQERNFRNSALMQLNGTFTAEGQLIQPGLLYKLKKEIENLKKIFVDKPQLQRFTVS